MKKKIIPPETGALSTDFWHKHWIVVIYATIFFALSPILILYQYYRMGLLSALAGAGLCYFLSNQLRYHRALLQWVRQSPEIRIFIYSSAGHVVKLIEKEILPHLPEDFVVVKNDNAHITGDMPRSIYHELHQQITLKDFPLLLTFRGIRYSRISFKKECKLLKIGETSETVVVQQILTALKQSPSHS